MSSTDTRTKYELTFILGEEASEKEAKSKSKEVADLIGKLEGSVEKEEFWGRRDLAYKIKRNRSGFYVTVWFDLAGSQIPALERQLRFDEEIIRSLVTKAYTVAQPGSLYPVAEEDEKASKPRRGARAEKEETATAEEELRRSSGTTKKAAKTEESAEQEEISEEERLAKLDESLGALLKDEE